MVLLTLICCISLIGCGADPKKEAERLNTEYFKPGFTLFENLLDDVGNLRKEFSDKRFDEGVAKLITENYKPQFVDMQNKFKNEKDVEDTKLMREQMGLMLDDVIILLDTGLELTSLPINAEKEVALPYFNKMQTTINNLVSEQVEYLNQYSLLTKGKSSYELTLRNYQKIQKGDSYPDVVLTFKMPGKLTNSEESNIRLIGHRKLDHYVWETGDGYVRIMFENGKAYMMEQKGLK